MNNEQAQPVDVIAEQEIVGRYAARIREAACGGRQPVTEGGRRCYELVNDCAMELAELTRKSHPDNAPVG